MRAWIRALGLVTTLAKEIGRFVFAAWVAVTVAASLAPLLFAVGIRSLVNGIGDGRTGDVVAGAVMCGAVTVVLAATPVAWRWVLPRVTERAIMAIQSRMLALLGRAPGLSHFEDSGLRDRLTLMQRNFGQLMQSMATIVVMPLAVVQLVVAGIVLARLEPWLLVLPIIVVPTGWLNRRAEDLRRRAEETVAEQRRTADHLVTLATSAQSAKEIRIYGLGDDLVQRHRTLADGMQQTMESALFRAEAVKGIGWLAYALAYLAAIITVVTAAADGRLNAGDVAVVLTLAAAVTAASAQLSNVAGILARAAATADDYQELTDRLQVRSDAARRWRVVPSQLQRGFELKDLSFTYNGATRPALRNVDVVLKAGSVVALVGENGAGKTTLVKLLSRMYEPTSGQILVDGVDLREFDISAWRQRVTAGFQDYAKFEFIVRESVGVGQLSVMGESACVQSALRKASADFVARFPSGLQTQLGHEWRDGVDVSGGEWQKIALARAFMRESGEADHASARPLLVVLDEPTAALDPQTEHALFEQISADARQSAADGRVTLLISHRFSTVRMADHIIVLKNGLIDEQGSHSDLMRRGGLYSELYTLQARSYGYSRSR